MSSTDSPPLWVPRPSAPLIYTRRTVGQTTPLSLAAHLSVLGRLHLSFHFLIIPLDIPTSDCASIVCFPAFLCLNVFIHTHGCLCFSSFLLMHICILVLLHSSDVPFFYITVCACLHSFAYLCISQISACLH